MRYIIVPIFLVLIACGINGRKSEHAKIETQWRQVPVGEVTVAVNDGDLALFETPTAPIYPTLIGGAPADRKDWPASFTTSQGNSRCTGTLLGPQVLQLAAHCVGDGRNAQITSNGKQYSGKCTHSPRYRQNATSDYALCYLTEPVDVEWYEGILTEPGQVKNGDKILLAGMGCTIPGGQGGGNDDVFRIGEAPVIRLPNGNDNDIVTRGSAALCFGDSGGSAFWKDDKGIYRVAGINSRGDIQTTSYLSATFTDDAKSFYTTWARQSGAVICGLTEGAQKCRGESTPDPTPVPPWCAATLAQVNKCIYGNPRLSLSDPEGCRKSYSELYACQVASERAE